MLRRGTLLKDTYEVIEEIGEGGAGIIYLACHLRLQKKVVIKKIKDNFVGRINERGEADILKKLHHRYLPQVYDFIQLGSEVYTVIDYIEGNDLMKYIQNGIRVDEKTIILWLRQLCEVLDYLHTQTPPIIHSDIKPANIMVTGEGDICLIDFNISLGGDGAQNVSGYSASYASPEQIYRNKLYSSGGNYMQVRLDGRTDIYSLGAAFFHLMMGISPADPQVAGQSITSYELPYSDQLLEIIEKAMRTNPMERYHTADDMLGDILHMKDRDLELRHWRRIRAVTYTAGLLFLTAGVIVGICVVREKNRESFQTEYQTLAREANSKDYEKIISDAVELLNNKRYTAVLKREKKEKADILYMIANSYFERDDYENANPYYQEVIKTDDNNPDYYRDYAISLARMKMTQDAGTILQEAIALGLEEDGIDLVKAEIALGENNPEEAVEYFEKTWDRTSDSYVQSRAFILCGRAYRALGQTENEIRVLDQGMQLVENEYIQEVKRALGAACLRYLSENGISGETEEESSKSAGYMELAIQCYQELTRQNDSGFNDHMNLALLYQMQGDHMAAETVMLDLAEAYPDDYRVYMRLALLELTIQTKTEENDRDYRTCEAYYKKAEEYYASVRNSGKSDDTMQQLESRIQELKDKGWLTS
ncbi:MAG: serine/threonine-protein kinase [Clostridia bacterium]|nr:serine/threonine-protein kinase [Clostridia bacterium]NCC44103.1 serine/threonine-protein kinase [Clostridia bacterium]